MGITIDGILTHRATLLHEFPIPEGMDKETLAWVIHTKARYYDMLYPNPDDMAFRIKSWAARHSYKWNGLWRSLSYKYDIFVNIDYEEKTVETVAVAGQQKGKAVDDGTLNAATKSDESGDTTRTLHDLTKGEAREDRTGKAVSIGESLTDNTTKGDISTTEDGTSNNNEHSEHTGNVDDRYQGFNSSAHRPVSRKDTDGTDDTHQDGKTHREQKELTTGESHTTTETHNTTTETGAVDTTSTNDKTVDENGASKTARTGSEDVKTGNVRDTAGEHSENTLREVIHTMKGDSSVRSAPSVIAEERALFELDVYQIIAQDFVEDFCVMVYNF